MCLRSLLTTVLSFLSVVTAGWTRSAKRQPMGLIGAGFILTTLVIQEEQLAWCVCVCFVFESTYFTYFLDLKKHDFSRFFEMVFQPVFKSTYFLKIQKT